MLNVLHYSNESIYRTILGNCDDSKVIHFRSPFDVQKSQLKW